MKNLTDFRNTVEGGVDPRLHLLTRVPQFPMILFYHNT